MITVKLNIAEDNADEMMDKVQREIITEVVEELKCPVCGASPKFISDTQINACLHPEMKEQIKAVNNLTVIE